MARAQDTGGGVAVARAFESRRADALFHDPEAARVAGRKSHRWYQALPDQTRTAMTSMVAVRTRWIDERVRNQISDGSEQVVVIGSGFDTRYAREVYARNTTVFELDFQSVLDEMTGRLRQSSLAYRRIPIGSDLIESGLSLLITDRHFLEGVNTTWIFEGVSAYIDEAVNRQVLSQARDYSGAGSMMLATFVGSSQQAYGPKSEKSAIHTFVTEDPARLMSQCGWDSQQYSLGDVASQEYSRHELTGYDYWLCSGKI